MAWEYGPIAAGALLVVIATGVIRFRFPSDLIFGFVLSRSCPDLVLRCSCHDRNSIGVYGRAKRRVRSPKGADTQAHKLL
jgi:hypothetical protein